MRQDPGMCLPASRNGRVSCALLTVFIVIVALEHVLQPGLPPGDHRISEYANGSPGWLMTIGFISWSAALFTASIALLHTPLRPHRLVQAVGILLMLAGLGAAATAAFKTGTSAGIVPPAHRLTTGNHIHDVGSGGLALALWIAVLVTTGLNDHRLRVQSAVLLVLGILVAVLFSDGMLDLPGVSQRTLVAIACTWQYLLLAASDRSSRPGRGIAR